MRTKATICGKHVQNNYIIIALWSTASIKLPAQPVGEEWTSVAHNVYANANAMMRTWFTFGFNNSYHTTGISQICNKCWIVYDLTPILR